MRIIDSMCARIAAANAWLEAAADDPSPPQPTPADVDVLRRWLEEWREVLADDPAGSARVERHASFAAEVEERLDRLERATSH